MTYNAFDAAKDLITGKLEYAEADIVEKRRAACDTCEVRNAALDVCTACGCFLPLKIKLKPSSCPLEIW